MREWLWASDRLLGAALVPLGLAVIGITVSVVRNHKLGRNLMRALPAGLLIGSIYLVYSEWLFKVSLLGILRDVVIFVVLSVAWVASLGRATGFDLNGLLRRGSVASQMAAGEDSHLESEKDGAGSPGDGTQDAALKDSIGFDLDEGEMPGE